MATWSMDRRELCSPDEKYPQVQNSRDWRDIAEEASKEHDRAKLLVLIKQLVEALDKKRRP